MTEIVEQKRKYNKVSDILNKWNTDATLKENAENINISLSNARLLIFKHKLKYLKIADIYKKLWDSKKTIRENSEKLSISNRAARQFAHNHKLDFVRRKYTKNKNT